VRAAVEGIVEEIRVQEGDQVKAGDVIARLADKDIRAELLKTRRKCARPGPTCASSR